MNTKVTRKQVEEARNYLFNINTQLGMTIYDPELAEIIKNKEIVEIQDKKFYIESVSNGACDGCYFLDKKCPQRAVTYCTSNGGNIIVEAEPNNE